MALPTVPVRTIDHAAGLRELERVYMQTQQRLETLIRIAAARGNRGSETYYRLQLLQIQATLTRLHTQAAPLARATIAQAYLSGAAAVDAHVEHVLPSFVGVNENAINQIAAALSAPLQRIGMTVGRQAADAYRQAGLLETGIGIGSGRTRRQTTAAITDRLARQGVTGFVDRAGRRWSMSTYASMVARTTTREAVTAGTVARLEAHGLDLVTVTESPDPCEICAPYEGETYSISGDSTEYDEIPDGGPPWHPNCTHVLAPADVELDSFIGALEGEPAAA